jgi:hypothetical protein
MKASLPHPPSTWSAKRQALTLASLALLVKGIHSPYLIIKKIYTHLILKSYKYLPQNKRKDITKPDLIVSASLLLLKFEMFTFTILMPLRINMFVLNLLHGSI